MSGTVVSTKNRKLAAIIARERLGLGPEYIRPEHKRDYQRERAAALRELTHGQTYYTAACFPAF